MSNTKERMLQEMSSHPVREALNFFWQTVEALERRVVALESGREPVPTREDKKQKSH